MLVPVLCLHRDCRHLALEAAKGGSSRHAAYIHTLPRNASSIGEYWTEDESRCALDWAHAAEYQQKLHVRRMANSLAWYKFVGNDFIWTPISLPPCNCGQR